MNTESQVWNKLKGLIPYNVTVHHNFWGGKYYESSYRSITVIAGSIFDAEGIAKNNLDVIEKHFRAMRLRKGSRTIRAIRKSEGYRLKSNDIRRVTKLYGAGCTKALNAEGEMIEFEFDTGGDR